MIERREPPRIVSGDLRPELIAPDATDRGRAVGAGKWRKPFRNFDQRRMILAVVTLVAGLAGLIYLGWLGQRTALAWLAAQPDYQVRFRDIQLIPEPPEWYRRGTATFLESVRLCARETETLPVIDPEPQRIKLSFEQSPWVEHVDRVRYLPREIRVELRYRKPVALVEISRSGNKYLLDEDARILPLEDVEVEELLRRTFIIKISGTGLLDPADHRAGKTWTPGPGVHDASHGNDKIPEAARLASFLVPKIRSLGPSHPRALEIRWIIPTDKDQRGLFLWDAEVSCPILWGKSLDDGPISPKERWEMLLAWSRANPKRPDPLNGYWEFTRNGMRFHITERKDTR